MPTSTDSPGHQRLVVRARESRALAACVAERDGQVVGNVALHGGSPCDRHGRAREALGAASDDELAVVARLIVDPITGAAASDGRSSHKPPPSRETSIDTPILDVVTRYDAANALYRAAGSTNAGEVEMRFADGTVLVSYVYLAPLTDKDKAVHLR